MQLDGKAILITGASQGIGAACAAVFRRRGARLALTARSADLLAQVAGPEDVIVPGDLTDAAVRRLAVDRALEKFGAIDVLINNAGIGLYAPTWQAPLDQVRAMFELNVFVPLEMIQLVAPHMRARRSGTIVTVSSIAGKMILPWFTLYSATKYAAGAMTEGLRMELRHDGVRTMVVCPGYVKTGFQSHVLAGRPPERLQRGKPFAITPERCAEAIARGLERDARTVVTPAIGWVAIAMQRLFPSLMEAQLARIYNQRNLPS